jgi:hypothetical protein
MLSVGIPEWQLTGVFRPMKLLTFGALFRLFLQGLVANLGHQHSKVRVAVLEALDALVAHGALPAGKLRYW